MLAAGEVFAGSLSLRAVLSGKHARMRLRLKPLLKERKLTQASFAAQVGISEPFLSEIIAGKKSPSLDTLNRMMEVLDVHPGAIYESQAVAPAVGQHGFAEPDVKLLELPREPDRARALRALKPDLRHPVFYAARSELLGLAILAGDTLVVDLNRKADHGDIVVITRIDPQTGESATLVRRWLDPWLISGRPDERPMLYNANDQEIAFLGVVAASLRGILDP